MTRAFWAGALARTRHLAWLWVLVGMGATWVIINLSAGPGVVITKEEEAEGPQFSDASTLDLVLHVNRSRACPSQTQRWIWRWADYRGERVQQVMALPSTTNPFLADSKVLVLTLPASGVPEPETGKWFFRSVTTEQCGFLPTWASGLFGGRMFRSPDVPVNFVGAPHGGVPPGTP